MEVSKVKPINSGWIDLLDVIDHVQEGLESSINACQKAADSQGWSMPYRTR